MSYRVTHFSNTLLEENIFDEYFIVPTISIEIYIEFTDSWYLLLPFFKNQNLQVENLVIRMPRLVKSVS